MSNEALTEVIARLEQRKAEIETTIAVLRRELLGENIATSALAAGMVGIARGAESREVQDDSFLGMRIPAACRRYLGMVKRPQTTADIAEALRKGGVHSTAANFTTTVYTALSRQDDIVRIGDKWSLREWHPTLRSQKKANGAASESSEESESEATEPTDETT